MIITFRQSEPKPKFWKRYHLERLTEYDKQLITAREHIKYLLQKHGIVAGTQSAKFDNAHATVSTRQVSIPEIKSLNDYAVALHEIGHILSDGSNNWIAEKKTTKKTLLREIKAWAMARSLSIIGWNNYMQSAEESGLNSYQMDAGNSKELEQWIGEQYNRYNILYCLKK